MKRALSDGVETNELLAVAANNAAHDNEGSDDNTTETSSSQGKGKDDKVAKLKKHPGAPKRFRTAFIIFSQQKHGELRTTLREKGAEIDTINVARMVSDQWREMSPEDKEQWEEMARQDKARYLKQKEEYSGPWKVPADMKKPKDPTAPKKPTPAYFSFSNERRQAVKKEHSTASNGEISKILSKMWKDADVETRSVYVEKEKTERDIYNKAVEEWKKERKESGRENWWEFVDCLPAEEDGIGSRKRIRLDMHPDAAPDHNGSTSGNSVQRMGAVGMDTNFHPTVLRSLTPQSALNSLHGASSSAFSVESLQEIISSQGGLQAANSLRSNLTGQGPIMPPGSNSHINTLQAILSQQEGPGNNWSPQFIDAVQQLLGGGSQQQPSTNNVSQALGNSLSFGGLRGGSVANTNHLLNQHESILAALLGGRNSTNHQSWQQQQQQQPAHQDHTSAQNINNILSLLQMTHATQQQQQNLHSPSGMQALQACLMQQGLFPQLQSPSLWTHSSNTFANGNTNADSVLASLLGQQQRQEQQYHPQQQQSSAQHQATGGTDSLLFQHLLLQQQQQQLQQQQQQEQGGGGGSSVPSQQEAPPPNVSSLEEAISRLIRRENGSQE